MNAWSAHEENPALRTLTIAQSGGVVNGDTADGAQVRPDASASHQAPKRNL
jgi:hypothetical protein